MHGKILVADDLETNLKLVCTLISKRTPYETLKASSGQEALNLLRDQDNKIDLVLLDINMPNITGFQVAEVMKNDEALRNIPIIFLTAKDTTEDVAHGFDLGGVDYVTKPFVPKILQKRIETHMKLKHYKDELESKVEERTKELHDLTIALVSILENANSFNDTDTGYHVKRVSFFSKAIAEELGLDQSTIGDIYEFASIHDIGKVAISDSILKKKGKLTTEEFEEMKAHSEIGFRIVDHQGIPDIAKNIVLYHHEQWDGSGYPQALKGEQIPIEARVVALADVYDALRSKRPYKEPFSEEKSSSIIIKSSGQHFDPKIVDIFKKLRSKFDKIVNELSD